MTLREYKIRHKLQMVELAELLELSVGHTSDLVNSRRGCSLEVAVRIEEITKGRVSCRDLLPVAAK